ncbi:rhodanese-like domain-containing protein [Flavobacteriaceae bacterium GSB9]|nr:rhodanese-like domain-containing protein [Flavobacteriaceae bacterium GSB9]
MKYPSLMALLIAFVVSCQPVSEKGFIEPEQLSVVLQQDEDIQLIDVRTPKEYNELHIKGAVNFNFYDENFAEHLIALNKEKPVYVYCRSGKRSAQSVAELKKQGFTTIYDLQGGILNWMQKGFNVTQ